MVRPLFELNFDARSGYAKTYVMGKKFKRKGKKYYNYANAQEQILLGKNRKRGVFGVVYYKDLYGNKKR